MAKVIPVGQPVNESERQAIGFLRDHLPENWLIFHNFEMRQGQTVFEIDLAILSPHAVYLVDIKGTRGNIDIYGSKWYPQGRQPFHSPLAKLRSHAKTLAGIIKDSNASSVELRKVHVHATVLLTADNADVYDPANLDKPDITGLQHCLRYFRDTRIIPHHRLSSITRFHSQIVKTITGRAKAKSAALVFRDWQVEEKLGGTDRFMEYRAKHTLLGESGGWARLRVYHADPYQDQQTRKTEFNKISNAYRAVAHMPSHANVLAVKDLFFNEDETALILVTEDLPGQALRLHINKPSLALTFDQKLQVLRDVLTALDHAHRYEVIHRNLTPDAILVTQGGQARVTSFDFARVGKNRTATIANQIIDDLDERYQSPETDKDPTQASIASDLYAAGLVFYELLTNELPFESIDQMMEADGKFPIKASEHKPDLLQGMDAWLQLFCEFDPEDRHTSAAIARQALEQILLPELQQDAPIESSDDSVETPLLGDLMNLAKDIILEDRFCIKTKLGSGGFGVAYKVFDLLGDVERVIKLVTKDRHSVYERLRREYKTLNNLPEHPHVVKVIWAGRMTDDERTPYIVFDFIDGLDVGELIESALSIHDAVQIVRETAEGLLHLHQYGVYHQDIKPANLLWTVDGIRIIDFNVAVSEDDERQRGGGTGRYIPPDYNHASPDGADRVDRDLYALGITFYECLTGKYPFDEPRPPINTQPKDPKQFAKGGQLSSSLINVLTKMIAPKRQQRFISADDFLTALNAIKHYRSVISSGDIDNEPQVLDDISFAPSKPNHNPFVTHLLTLYSQSQLSNTGTRGLDAIGKATYVSTYLDEKLKPALIKGQFSLVIISGNAGDGKTAFIQQFELFAEDKGAQIKRTANGAVFQLNGHTFISNYDGSQDEGDEQNESVLQTFFADFTGQDQKSWRQDQTRLIAINEGRLVDFFLQHQAQFPYLSEQIQQGLAGAQSQSGLAVINLNLRSVVADDGQGSILQRLLQRMVFPAHWQACESCDIRHKCYVYHNVKTFQDSNAGVQAVNRLKQLYTITHLRGRLHITLRDLRSALAFMLVGTRGCDAIHQLYQQSGEDNQQQILNGFYFNAWLGAGLASNDRLLALLAEIDVALVSNPELDRALSFTAPAAKTMNRFTYDERSTYDNELLAVLFHQLPRDYTLKNRHQMMTKHRQFLAHLRRRHFFERRDAGWQSMLPYHSINDFLSAIKSFPVKSNKEVVALLDAINRGEGLNDPKLLGKQLALRVRQVDKATIRSYRLFASQQFCLQAEQQQASPFLEWLPQALTLRYQSEQGQQAEMRINLDIYEMLMRLNQGYRPSIEEQQGFYLSLTVFKNVLASAPYQQVLLTERGFEFFQINRDQQGVLHLEKLSRSEPV